MAKALNVWVNIGAKVGPSVAQSANKVTSTFKSMARQIKLANAEFAAANSKLRGDGDIRGQVFDIAAMGYTAGQFMKPAVEFEDALVRMGNTASVRGEQLKKFGNTIVDTGLKYGIGGRAAIGGVNAFVAAGVFGGQGMTGEQELAGSVSALDATLKLARVAGITPEEAAGAGIGAMKNLGVEAKDLGVAFDYMSSASKEGNFELRDMAKYMTRLSSSAKQLGFGFKGTQGVAELASMLQVVMSAASDPEQGQNNLYNLMEKMFSNETSKKFDKLTGQQDYLRTLYKSTQAAGTSYFDAVIQKVSELSNKGQDPFVFSSSFEDMQARSALQALVTNYERLQQVRTKVLGSKGGLDADWAEIQKTTAQNWMNFTSSIEALGIALNQSVLPSVNRFLDKMTKLTQQFGVFVKEHPKVASAMAKMAAAFVGFIIGGKIFAIVGTALARFGLVVRWLWTIFRGANLLKWFRGAALGARLFLAVLGVPAGAIGVGIVAAIALIGAAIIWIIKKWEGFKAFFAGFAEGFNAAIEPVRPQLEAFGKWITETFKPLFSWFADVFKAPDAKELAGWKSAGVMIGEAVGGIVAAFVRLVEWATKATSSVQTFFNNGNDLRRINPSTGATAGTIAGEAIAKSAPGRARGGGVSAGHWYRINEKGQELFAPGRSGSVVPARATAALMAALSTGPAMAGQTPNMPPMTVNIYGANDPQSTRTIVRQELARVVGRASDGYSD